MADRGSTNEDPVEGTDEQAHAGKTDYFAERVRYAYLFHLWTEPRRSKEPPVWRFSLEEVDSGVRHGFGNWEAFVEFLRRRMEAA